MASSPITSLQINGENMETVQISYSWVQNAYGWWLLLLLLLSCFSRVQLCDPVDDCPLGSSVPEILQARILERVAISFSNAWNLKVKVKSLSCARLLATPWTAAHPGSSIHGIFQARVLEWGSIAFSKTVAVSLQVLLTWVVVFYFSGHSFLCKWDYQVKYRTPN